MFQTLYKQKPITAAIKFTFSIPVLTSLLLTPSLASTYIYDGTDKEYVYNNILTPRDAENKTYVNDFNLVVENIANADELSVVMTSIKPRLENTPTDGYNPYENETKNLKLKISDTNNLLNISAIDINLKPNDQTPFIINLENTHVEINHTSAESFNGISVKNSSIVNSRQTSTEQPFPTFNIKNYVATISNSEIKNITGFSTDNSYDLNFEGEFEGTLQINNVDNFDNITNFNIKNKWDSQSLKKTEIKSLLNITDLKGDDREIQRNIIGIKLIGGYKETLTLNSDINFHNSNISKAQIKNIDYLNNDHDIQIDAPSKITINAKSSLKNNKIIGESLSYTGIDYSNQQSNIQSNLIHSLTIDNLKDLPESDSLKQYTFINGIFMSGDPSTHKEILKNQIVVSNSSLSNSYIKGVTPKAIFLNKPLNLDIASDIEIKNSTIKKGTIYSNAAISGIDVDIMYQNQHNPESEIPDSQQINLNSYISLSGSNNQLKNNATSSPTYIHGNVYGIELRYNPPLEDKPSPHLKLASTIEIKGDVFFHPDAEIVAIKLLTNSGAPLAPQKNIDTFSNTALEFSAKPIKLKNIGHFETYRFTLDPSNKAPLITAENIYLNNRGAVDSTAAFKTSSIEIVGIKGGRPLIANETFVLMKATDHLESEGYEPEISKAVAQQGISFLYDVTTGVDEDNKEVIATIGQISMPITELDPSIPPILPDPTKPAVTVNPALKSLSEGYLAGAMLVSRGQDTLVQEAFNKTELELPGWHAFGAIKGGYNRYQSGSHINSKDLTGIAGVKFTNDAFTYGGFIEGGTSDYDTHNTYAYTGKVKGDGDSKFYGFGALAKYQFTPYFYIDGSLRYGKTTNKFNADAIQNLVTGQIANYDVNSNYYSAHLRLGNNIALNASDVLNLSATYLYSHVKGKNVIIAGDPINFKSIDSNRLQLRALWERELNENSFFNAGIGYEYEFSGTAKATTYDFYDIDEPTVKGGTALLDIGYSYIPESNNRVQLDFGVEGYYGKRRGGSVSFKVNYEF